MYVGVLEIIVWVSLLAVMYGYIGYPAVIWVLSRVFGRGEWGGAAAALPTMSILIVACDEEDVIAARIENALRTDYPADFLEIAIASDGSTDGTEDIVKRYSAQAVRLFASPLRRGKAAVLNEVIPQLRGEIIFLSDANTSADVKAAGIMAGRFADPKVGVVCGRLVVQDAEDSGNSDSIYWRYETFLKRCESRLGALLGANGGIYAIRASRFCRIPEGTVIDDLSIPLLMRLKHGARMVYAEDAVAVEPSGVDLQSEFGRRARFGAGSAQVIRLLYPLLYPRNGWVAFSLFSHKIIRWLCPWFLLAMFIASDLLALSHRYRPFLLLQVIFYAASIVPMLLPIRWRMFRLLNLFTTMNAALLVGVCRYVFFGADGTWRRTARTRT
jgi:cellulose synthase/poly-beta-1,6-N-acetylglucosamine synthase-like glycosyltransferase